MKPNIVLVVADTARASNLSLYGYEQETSPNLESIANECTLYENTIATAPWTMPSHASIFTGKYSSHHGSTRSSPQLEDDEETLHQILSANGYSNWLFTANPGISSVTNGDFEEYLTRRRIPTGTDYTELKSDFRASGFGLSTVKTLLEFLRNEGSFVDIINLADKYLSNHLERRVTNPRRATRKGSKNNLKLFSNLCNQSNTPYFAYVNIMEPHLKYMPPKESRRKFAPEGMSDEELWSVNQDSRLFNYAKAVDMDERDFALLEALYNGSLHYTDQIVGKMYEHLKQNGQLDDTVFIFIGDHGENIGNKGLIGHSLSLNDSLLRVPMMVSYPENSGGDVREQLVQLHDLFPTIIEEAGLSDQVSGRDAVRLPKEESDKGRDYAIAEYLGSPFKGIQKIIRKYPEVDYGQYDYEIKSIYSDQAEKYTIYSTGESTLEKVRIDSETQIDSCDSSDRKVELHDELFARVDDFGVTNTRTNSNDLSEYVENRLKDLGYI